jgi:hypothetical protein
MEYIYRKRSHPSDKTIFGIKLFEKEYEILRFIYLFKGSDGSNKIFNLLTLPGT